MLIIGYKGTVDWGKVRASLKKCTSMTQTDIDRLVKVVKSGKTMMLDDDFVLHDELRDLGILIK